MTKANWSKKQKVCGLIAASLLAATIFHQVSRADDSTASEKILLKREQSCVDVGRELAGTMNEKLMKDAPTDFDTVHEAHTSLSASGQTVHFLRTLFYLNSLAPQSFRPKIREVLVTEIKDAKAQNTSSLNFLRDTLNTMTDVPAALAVNHAKQSLENYQSELEALKP